MSAIGTAETQSAAWLRRFHPGPERQVRLVCFPHAGGSASFYHPVSARFAGTAEVLTLQYPGRQERRKEPCVEDIGTLADRVAEVLRPLPAKPTVYFGHSMGAVLAFETAVRLERGGLGPSSIVASGRRAPSTTRDEAVHKLDDAGVIAELRLLNGTAGAALANEEILRMSLPAIRGDYTAIETYTCPAERTVSCPVTAVTGADDPKTTLDEARAWEAHTTGAFDLRVLPGGHFFIVDQNVAVNDLIGEHLAQVAIR